MIVSISVSDLINRLSFPFKQTFHTKIHSQTLMQREYLARLWTVGLRGFLSVKATRTLYIVFIDDYKNLEKVP